MNWLTTGKPSEYTYSDTAYVRKWRGGGYISVKVGYVKKHPENNQIVLEKVWPIGDNKYKSQNFNIKGKDDWLSLKSTIERLWPEIETLPSKEVIDKAIEKVSKDTELLELISRYPELLTQTKDVDILLLPPDQKKALSKLLTVGGQIANSVIEKLAAQPIRDIEQFVKLLDELKLSTINSLVTHVTSRVSFINMFEKVIHDDKSFEKKGVNSVHKLLKVNIWMIDRNYSILHDDETLKTIIHNQWGKDIKIEEEEKEDRPDFLCMIDRLSEKNGYKKLIIIEIKRPSIKIKLKHVEQVMGYKKILEKYSGKHIDEFSSFIVGNTIDELLLSNDLSKSGYTVKTYTDFIREARNFYEEYLQIIKKEEFAF